MVVEEKWLIAMGDLLLTNYQPGSLPNTIKEQGDVTQAQTHNSATGRQSSMHRHKFGHSCRHMRRCERRCRSGCRHRAGPTDKKGSSGKD